MVKHIKTGNRVEIGFKEGEGRKKLTTIVETVLNKNQVLIAMPIAAGSMVKLPLKDGFEARFFTGTSIISYDVSVVDHPFVDGSYLTTLQLESKGEKVQLRDFYRIDSAIDFTFTLVKDQLNEDAEGSLTMHKALTKDLSGGGMSFVTDLEMVDGTEIYANFILDGDYIMVLGRVAGKQRDYNAAYKYVYRCQFLAMPDMEREKILKYINAQQFKSVR